jgi:PAS domain-containing protein
MERVARRVHPDDLAIVRQVIDEASRGDKVDITHRLLMPDGSVKFVHVLGDALKDAAGNLEIVGAVMDVTERKRAEERLRVQHTVAQILTEAVTIEEATPRILRAVRGFASWSRISST